jgi:hypothetical protein
MKTITEQSAILALLPDFSQTILEDGGNGETVEHGFLNQGEESESKARVIYTLPADGKYDQDSGEFLGDWNAHIVRMEIDEDGEFVRTVKTLGPANARQDSTHTNAAGATYFSTTDENGQTIYSFTPDFEDIWTQEDQDAIEAGSTPSKI